MLKPEEVTKTAEYSELVLAVLIDEVASLKATATGSLFVDERDAIMSKVERASKL